jgi:23S rRNA pseudouridine1911/1915/1917 synthase
VKILFEDEYLLCIDKPAGVITTSGKNIKGPTLQDYVKKNFETSISGNDELRSGIVHRIDKETSGIVVVAKNEEIYFSLQELFGKRDIKKTYVALVHGNVRNGEGVIDEPVGRLPYNRTRFGVYKDGREAKTLYKVVERIGEYSLVEACPQSGRTHQIRVHFKYIGHPIVSDPLYAGRKTLKKDLLISGRMFLHASAIEFLHPVMKKQISVKSELPQELADTLHALASTIS